MQRLSILLLCTVCLGQAYIVTVTGPPSTSSDGGESAISCTGTYDKALSCSCHDMTLCDGAYLHTDGVCKAFCNRDCYFNSKTMLAVVVCGRSAEYQQMKYPRSPGYEVRPTLSCGANFRMLSCALMNWWGEYYAIPPKVVMGNGSCAVDKDCTVSRGCWLSAACQGI